MKGGEADDVIPEEDGGIILPSPSMMININSDRPLEVTITKKCLEVLNNLAKVTAQHLYVWRGLG